MLAFAERPIPLASLPPRMRLRLVSNTAACGFPSPAADWEDDTLDLVKLLRLDAANAFAFRLSGSSMIDVGLHDRDIVVLDRGVRPKNGAIVVAIVEGGFVCRQFAIRHGVPHLEARNAKMSYPVCICDESVEIFGVVRASVRDLSA